ncbi:MAG: hypothetical protein WBX15_12125 [Thermoanaerobaculia bacterium]
MTTAICVIQDVAFASAGETVTVRMTAATSDAGLHAHLTLSVAIDTVGQIRSALVAAASDRISSLSGIPAQQLRVVIL